MGCFFSSFSSYGFSFSTYLGCRRGYVVSVLSRTMTYHCICLLPLLHCDVQQPVVYLCRNCVTTKLVPDISLGWRIRMDTGCSGCGRVERTTSCEEHTARYRVRKAFGRSLVKGASVAEGKRRGARQSSIMLWRALRAIWVGLGLGRALFGLPGTRSPCCVPSSLMLWRALRAIWVGLGLGRALFGLPGTRSPCSVRTYLQRLRSSPFSAQCNVFSHTVHAERVSKLACYFWTQHRFRLTGGPQLTLCPILCNPICVVTSHRLWSIRDT